MNGSIALLRLCAVRMFVNGSSRRVFSISEISGNRSPIFPMWPSASTVRTCRPHYHLGFFGLKRSHLNYLLDKWRFGKVKQVRMVQCVNKDGSSGFTKASKYIGKYMSKGQVRM